MGSNIFYWNARFSLLVSPLPYFICQTLSFWSFSLSSKFPEHTEQVVCFRCFLWKCQCSQPGLATIWMLNGDINDSLLEVSDLVVLNDGTGTRLNPNSPMSSLDLNMVSYEHTFRYAWQVHEDNFGSDHFSMIVSFSSPLFELVHWVVQFETVVKLIGNLFPLTILQMSLQSSSVKMSICVMLH